MKTRKILSLIVAMAIILCTLPFGTLTASAATSGTIGDFTWTLDGTVLTISGSGSIEIPLLLPDQQSPPWWQNSTVTKVIIENGITYIGIDAFYGCYSLTSVTIPNSVIGISDDAFYGCQIKTIYYYGTKEEWDSVFISPYSGLSSNAEIIFTNIKDFTYTTTNKTVTITKYNGNESNVTIPNEIYGYPVTNISENAFYNCSSLTSITIPNSVTSIGEGAFYGCISLESITLPFVGSSREANGTYDAVFGYIFGSSSISSSGTTEQNYNSSSKGYYYIPLSLKTVKITDATQISYGAFYNCSSLTQVTISDSVTSIGDNAFYSCAALSSVTLSKNIKRINKYTFYDCQSLSSITIPNGVTSIGYRAFHGCILLSDIKIPDSVATIDSCAFVRCIGLKTVSLSKNVSKIDSWTFSSCTSLTYITLPNSVTNIGDSAFYGCNSIKTVYYCGTEEEWDSISISQYNEPLIKAKIIFTNINDFTYTTTNNTVTITKYNGNKSNVTIPNEINGYPVTSIGDDAFSLCSSLTSVTIPDSVTSIGYYAFEDCSSLKRVNITDLAAWCNIDFENGYSNPLYYAKNLYINGTLATDITIPDSVTEIKNYAFYNCSSLTSITIPSSVTSIGNYAFYNCSSLTSVIIPDSVTSIGSLAFCDCSSLTSITVPDSVITIDQGVFRDCSSLTSITIPDDVIHVGDSAFRDCSSLTAITIPDRVRRIDDYAFSGCSSLNRVNITDLAAWCNINFGSSTSNPLYYAKNLYINGTLATDITIPNTVTKIKDYAFYNCSSLTSVTIPDSVTSINNYAFKGCSSLETVYYHGTERQWNDFNIDSSNDCLLNANIIFCCVCGESNFSNWKITVEATCTEEGLRERTCNNCDKKWTDIIPLIEHNIVDGKCSMCGIKETIIIESEHNYANNTNKTWTVTRENAIKMKITFSGDTFVEENYDFIYIYDKNNKEIGRYTGHQLTFETITVKGNTVTIKLTSDGSGNNYGFKAEITPIYPDKGDVSGDGILNSSDAVILKKALLGINKLTAEEIEAYDLNGDNKVNILDLIRIKKLIANL